MEFIPLNDGFNIFIKGKLSDWMEQKKYFLDVFQGV